MKIAVVALSALALAASAQAGQRTAGVPCSLIGALGLERQTNLNASATLVRCGVLPGGGGTTAAAATTGAAGPNVDVVTGDDAPPAVTQSEDQIAVHGATVAVAYNDSSDDENSQYAGYSVSTDGGATFTRIKPSPFATGHGSNLGDPVLVWDAALGKFVAGDLVGGCGGQGIGLWTSADGQSWAAGTCAHNGGDDDRESMAVDNNPSSPHYGRLYLSWNDFTVAGGALVLSYSDDARSWTGPVTLSASATFMRDVQVNVGPDGTVFVGSMDEGGGAFNPRRNYMFRSTDGGAHWSSPIAMGASFAAPGDEPMGPYFVGFMPIWRHMGWGDTAVCTGGKLVYAYTQHGAGADAGDIMIVRSSDNGSTWSDPRRIDGDAGINSQWMPTVAATGSTVFVSWYDRRNAPDRLSYERFATVSQDCGDTWSVSAAISDVLITEPLQPDPLVQATYAGDYMRSVISGDYVYDAWTDGRDATRQQDVELAKVDVVAPRSAKVSISPPDAVQTSTSVTVSWTAKDAGIGVASYDVLYQAAAAADSAFADPVVWQSATTAKSASFDGSPGTSYCFVVRARDNAGNVSAPSKPACTTIPLDDRALSGDWTHGSGAAYFQQTFSSSSSAGDSLGSGAVYAKSVVLLVDRCPTCGSVEVFWKRTSLGTFSLTAGSTLHNQLVPVASFAGVRSGKLKIVVASGTPVIDGVAFTKT